MGILSDIKK